MGVIIVLTFATSPLNLWISYDWWLRSPEGLGEDNSRKSLKRKRKLKWKTKNIFSFFPNIYTIKGENVWNSTKDITLQTTY